MEQETMSEQKCFRCRTTWNVKGLPCPKCQDMELEVREILQLYVPHTHGIGRSRRINKLLTFIHSELQKQREAIEKRIEEVRKKYSDGTNFAFREQMLDDILSAIKN